MSKNHIDKRLLCITSLIFLSSCTLGLGKTDVYYEVKFVNDNNDFLYSTFVLQNTNVVYQGPNPTKTSDDERFSYEFIKWNQSLDNIDGNKVLHPQFELVYNLHTPLQHQFFHRSDMNSTSLAGGTEELSRPLSINIDWSNDTHNEKYNFVISKYEDYSHPFYSLTNISNKYYDVWNLEKGTRYFYKVETASSNEIVKEDSLKTSNESIRNLYVSGVTNVRDLGGYKTLNGKYVHQGLAYRCGRLNHNNEEVVSPKITEKGIDMMVNTLGIKCEIDLRKIRDNEVGGLTTTSVLGDEISYFQCPMEYNGNMLKMNKEEIRNVFEVLGDKKNYPFCFHCSIGTDRTGMLAYVLNALLGVSINDLYNDYLFSNFGNIGSSRSIAGISGSYIATINNYKGNTLSQKVYNYLINEVHASPNDINTFIEMMIEQ